MQINCGGVLKDFILPLRCLDDMRMAMPNAHRDDAAQAIEIASSAFVEKILAFALDEHDRFFVVEKNPRIQKLFAQPQDLLGRRASVRCRLVIKWWQWWRFHFYFSQISPSP